MPTSILNHTVYVKMVISLTGRQVGSFAMYIHRAGNVKSTSAQAKTRQTSKAPRTVWSDPFAEAEACLYFSPFLSIARFTAKWRLSAIRTLWSVEFLCLCEPEVKSTWKRQKKSTKVMFVCSENWDWTLSNCHRTRLCQNAFLLRTALWSAMGPHS